MSDERLERLEWAVAEIADALYRDSRVVRRSPLLCEFVNANRERVRAREAVVVEQQRAARLAAREAAEAPR
jgi:hypothetical protein